MEPKKILFANIPYDGHFNPLTSLAVYLKDQGHDVRWYAGNVYKEKLLKLNIPHFSFRHALELNQNNLNEIFPERQRIKNQVAKLKFDIRTSFILRGPEFYEDIKEINHEWNFDLMISDICFTGTPFIKDLLKKPVISIGVLPIAASSVDLPPNGLAMTPSNSFFGKRKQDVLRFFSNKIIFKESYNLMSQLFKDYGVEKAKGNIFDVLYHKSDLVLQSGTPGFEYKRSDLNENIRFIGALLPYNSGRKSAFDFTDKISLYEKVILVTQGTVEKDPEKIIVPTLEAFKDTDYLVIVTTGGSKTKELKERYPNRNVIIEDFIPFNEIMPYCDVYITNGGYGGVMLGIENQLPLVVAGVHEGKNEINARVGYFQLGIDLKTETPTAFQLKQAVDEVINKPLYRQNVRVLGKEFKKYNPQLLTEYYVNELLGNKYTEEPSQFMNALEVEVC